MALPNLWGLWGMGWLLMPRMTIGLIIVIFTKHDTLGIILAIIGGLTDLFGGK